MCLSSSEPQQPSELQGEAVEEEEEEEEKIRLSRLNQQLRSQTAQVRMQKHHLALLSSGAL